MDHARFGASANSWLQKGKQGCAGSNRPTETRCHCVHGRGTRSGVDPKRVQNGVSSMTKLLKQFLNDERGAAAEYALILAVIGAGIAAAALALGVKIGDVIKAVTALITVPA